MVAKPRKKQGAQGRTGKGFSPQEQAILQTVWSNLDDFAFSKKTGKKTACTKDSVFSALTGFNPSTVRKQLKKQKKTQDPKKPVPPKKKGPKPIILHEKFEEFYDWLSETVETAKKGKYLTLRMLKRSLRLEKGIIVSLNVLRRSLKAMGFSYVKRTKKWISRRCESHILLRLQDFCEYCVQHSERIEDPFTGKTRYRWKIPVSFQDESWLTEKQFREKSWSSNKDKSLDYGSGEGCRLNMIHCIFSEKSPQPIDPNTGRPEALVVTKSTWVSEKHEWKGGTTDATIINKYFREKVFVNTGEGGVNFLDNASTHSKRAQDLDEMSEEELLELIQKKLGISGQVRSSKNHLSKFRKEYSNFRWKAAHAFMDLPAGRSKGDLKKIIRDYRLYDTELYLLAQQYEQKLTYLPQYYPELNPIERWWCLLKRYYYDTDANLNWETRLDEALGKIPLDYVEKCFSKSLEWAWKRWQKFQDDKQKPHMASIGDDTGEEEDEHECPV